MLQSQMLSLVLLDDEAMRALFLGVTETPRYSRGETRERYTAEVVNCLSSREMSNGAIVVCATAHRRQQRHSQVRRSPALWIDRQECSTDIHFASQLQRSAKVGAPGCVNAARKLRQK